MKLNKEAVTKYLDSIFKNEIETLLDCNYENLSKIKEANNTIHITKIDKKDISIDDMFLESLKLLDKKNIIEAEMKKDGTVFCVIHKKGRPIYISGYWDNVNEKAIHIANENNIIVSKNNKMGVISERGTIKIEPKYNQIIESLNEYLWVKENQDDYSCGLITTEDVSITPHIFFISGKRLVKINNELCILGKTKTSECIYNFKNKPIIKEGLYKKISIDEAKNIILVKTKDNKIGVIKENKIIIEPKYEHLNPILDVYQITENKKIGLLDANGNKITEIDYDNIIKCNNNEIKLLKKDINNNISYYVYKIQK
jgi:hypothetical protein